LHNDINPGFEPQMMQQMQAPGNWDAQAANEQWSNMQQ